MCVAYRLSLRVVWLFFPQCPSGPRSRVGCLFGTVRASAVSNAHCLGGHCGARTQPDRVHPHPQDRRPGDRGVGPASRPRLGRMPAQGGRTQLASAPRQVWHLHEGLLKLPHPTGRMGGGAHAALRRRRPHLLRRPPPFHARRLRVYLASQVDAVLAHLHAAWSKCLSLQCPSSAPAPSQGTPDGSAQPGRTTGHPATASAARAGRLPTNPPIPPPSSTQAFYAGLHKRDCPKQWDWCAGHAIVCAAGGVFVRHGSDAEQARPFDIDCAGGVCAGTPALAAVLQRELLAS